MSATGFRAFLDPPPAVHPRTDDPTLLRYIRAYLILRILVGGLGIVLPLLLVFGDKIAFDGTFPRDSLSDYYYSGAREVFVGALWAFSVFLITYKVSEANLDNLLSLVAGIAVLIVAVFPTNRSEDVPLTELQKLIHEGRVADIHFVFAALFIGALAVISYLFGKREGDAHQYGKRSPAFWRAFHWICAGVIVLALLWCLATWQIDDLGPDEALLYGEAVAVFAFGVSWLWKGYERETLFKRPRQ